MGNYWTMDIWICGNTEIQGVSEWLRKSLSLLLSETGEFDMTGLPILFVVGLAEC